MPRGESIAAIIGSDRPVPPPVIYGPPKPKPKGLDWDALRPYDTSDATPRDTRPVCRGCKDRADFVNPDGLCIECVIELDPHRQPDRPYIVQEPELSDPHPRQPILFAFDTEIPLPDWAADLVVLLVDTERHEDPTVRTIRKIVTQAGLALLQASKTSGPAATTAAHTPDGGSTPPAGPEPSTRKGKKLPDRRTIPGSPEARIAALGVDPKVIRDWAKGQGLKLAPRLSHAIVDAYEKAHAA